MVENETEVKKTLKKVRAVPITVSYDMTIKLDSEIDVFKCSQALMDSMKQVYGDDNLGYRHYRNVYLAKNAEKFCPDVGKIVDHMDYIISLIGDDHVGLGSDYDCISIVPRGIEDVSKMPEITRIMLERGYSEERIKKILGGNFMRVFREVSVP